MNAGCAAGKCRTSSFIFRSWLEVERKEIGEMNWCDMGWWVEYAKRRSSNRRYLQDLRFWHQFAADKFMFILIRLIIYSNTLLFVVLYPHLEIPSKSEWTGIDCWLITCDAMLPLIQWSQKHKLYNISVIMKPPLLFGSVCPRRPAHMVKLSMVLQSSTFMSLTHVFCPISTGIYFFQNHLQINSCRTRETPGCKVGVNVVSWASTLIEGSLETKVPTIWTDEKQHSQEKAEPGRNSDV